MEKLKKLSKYRNLILVVVDCFCIIFAYYLGAVLIQDSVLNFSEYYLERVIKSAVCYIAMYELIFHIAKRHKSIIRYEEGKDYVFYILLCLMASMLVSIIKVIFKVNVASLKMNVLAGLIISMMLVAYRIIARYILINDVVNKGIVAKKNANKKNLLIIGAGNAAHEIIKTINTNFKEDYDIIGIIDDNKKRLNFTVSGVKIIGNRNDIVKVCKENDVELVLVKAPSLYPYWYDEWEKQV